MKFFKGKFEKIPHSGELGAIIGIHRSTFRGGVEERHDSGSGEASKLAASAPRFSTRTCALIWSAAIVVTWGAVIWAVAAVLG